MIRIDCDVDDWTGEHGADCDGGCDEWEDPPACTNTRGHRWDGEGEGGCE